MKHLSLVALTLFSLIVMVSTVYAQPKEIDTQNANKIIDTGILGLSVTTITELITRKLKTTGIGSIAVSGVVALGATASWLATAGQFAFDSLGIYGTIVFAIANGFYKFASSGSK